MLGYYSQVPAFPYSHTLSPVNKHRRAQDDCKYFQGGATNEGNASSVGFLIFEGGDW